MRGRPRFRAQPMKSTCVKTLLSREFHSAVRALKSYCNLWENLSKGGSTKKRRPPPMHSLDKLRLRLRAGPQTYENERSEDCLRVYGFHGYCDNNASHDKFSDSAWLCWNSVVSPLYNEIWDSWRKFSRRTASRTSRSVMPGSVELSWTVIGCLRAECVCVMTMNTGRLSDQSLKDAWCWGLESMGCTL